MQECQSESGEASLPCIAVFSYYLCLNVFIYFTLIPPNDRGGFIFLSSLSTVQVSSRRVVPNMHAA